MTSLWFCRCDLSGDLVSISAYFWSRLYQQLFNELTPPCKAFPVIKRCCRSNLGVSITCLIVMFMMSWCINFLNFICFILVPAVSCLPNPCHNDGTCTLHDHGYFCSCPADFKGPSCSSKCQSIFTLYTPCISPWLPLNSWSKMLPQDSTYVREVKRNLNTFRDTWGIFMSIASLPSLPLAIDRYIVIFWHCFSSYSSVILLLKSLPERCLLHRAWYQF